MGFQEFFNYRGALKQHLHDKRTHIDVSTAQSVIEDIVF